MSEIRLDNHDYFLQIEEYFVDLRGAPLLLSPADWQVAKRWHEEQIPLELIKTTLKEILDRRRERDPKSKFVSLKYFDRAVRKQWRSRQELTAPARGRLVQEEPLDIAAKLRRLARALPAELLDGKFATRVEGLTGSPSEVEEELEALDREVISALEGSLSTAQTRQLDRSLESAMTRLAKRLPAGAIESSRSELRERLLREKHKVPLLSLFAPEAEEEP